MRFFYFALRTQHKKISANEHDFSPTTTNNKQQPVLHIFYHHHRNSSPFIICMEPSMAIIIIIIIILRLYILQNMNMNSVENVLAVASSPSFITILTSSSSTLPPRGYRYICPWGCLSGAPPRSSSMGDSYMNRYSVVHIKPQSSRRR